MCDMPRDNILYVDFLHFLNVAPSYLRFHIVYVTFKIYVKKANVGTMYILHIYYLLIITHNIIIYLLYVRKFPIILTL